jgi:archaellum biogenesis protein FlaJ (TadC family)
LCREILKSVKISQVPSSRRDRNDSQSVGYFVPVPQYIIYTLTRQATLAYTVQTVPENLVAQQQASFDALVTTLGSASDDEIKAVLREIVKPEAGLTPEMIQRLQKRIADKTPKPLS